MLTYAEALQAVLDRITPNAPRPVPLAEALGLAVATDVQATEDVPPFTNSAMDGYAVRAADLAGESPRLRVLGDLPAGGLAQFTVEAGTAVRIMTGAPLPMGADTVVPVEHTASGADWVEVRKVPKPGAHIRQAGEDIAVGTRILQAGLGLRPGDIGVLAAIGQARVAIHPRVRVAVLTTGDELVDVSESPGPSGIRDANIHALCAQVAACGAVPVPFARVPDDRATLERVLRQAAEADMILTTGGISVGDYDFVKAILEDLGARRIFWKVAQKPGGPLGFWTLGGKPVFGIPGNPVAAMLMVELYVRPALRKMMGFTKLFRPEVPARLDQPWRKVATDHRVTFLRVVARQEEDGWHASLTGPQGSGILSSMMRANALAVMPGGIAEVPAGGPVTLSLTELAEDR